MGSLISSLDSLISGFGSCFFLFFLFFLLSTNSSSTNWDFLPSSLTKLSSTAGLDDSKLLTNSLLGFGVVVSFLLGCFWGVGLLQALTIGFDPLIDAPKAAKLRPGAELSAPKVGKSISLLSLAAAGTPIIFRHVLWACGAGNSSTGSTLAAVAAAAGVGCSAGFSVSVDCFIVCS